MPLGTRLITEKRRSVRSELGGGGCSIRRLFPFEHNYPLALAGEAAKVKCLPGHLNFGDVTHGFDNTSRSAIVGPPSMTQASKRGKT